ncbi:MAG TPA: hypothetical protein VGC76_19330 [Pyrinomonadaceae bacterium]|jgi:hypothetical protein
MKVLKQILFAAAVMICFSMTASAQKGNGDDKKPKNPNPPQIIVIPKNEDKNKPKGDDRPREDKKKPESAYLKSSNEDETAVI